ncbi:hypothetical protein ACOMHN_030331 [Nucella lapillus]
MQMIYSQLQFTFDEDQLILKQELPENTVTKTIEIKQPWQVKFLITAKVEKQLPTCLQQTMTVNSDMKSVHIQAPFRTVDKYVIKLWQYVAQLSQQVIPLTAASTQVLRTSDSRKRVQTVLDGEGVVCHWHVDQGQLVISAHYSDIQQVKNLFMAEIETAQQALQPQNRNHRRKPQTENHSVNTEGKQNRSLATLNSQQTEDVVMENSFTCTRSTADLEERQADNTDTRTTQRQGIPQRRPQLSPPPSHELTTPSLPRHNSQSPVLLTEDGEDGDHCSQQQSSQFPSPRPPEAWRLQTTSRPRTSSTTSLGGPLTDSDDQRCPWTACTDQCSLSIRSGTELQEP